MNAWISADLEHNKGKGLTGKLGALGNVIKWTKTDGNCCDIGDMGVDDVWDNDDAEGAQAEAIAQEDLQVAAAHLGGIMQ